MLQTGSSKADRREFLSEFYSTARATLIHEWHPVEIAKATF
jgi:hypothetical protein